ncbi:MAG: hypothetical protein E7575_01165 [Ruminococcaceae bacterium]|nr:hypothetical protein [Oscillospiraceae bacterium]
MKKFLQVIDIIACILICLSIVLMLVELFIKDNSMLDRSAEIAGEIGSVLLGVVLFWPGYDAKPSNKVLCFFAVFLAIACIVTWVALFRDIILSNLEHLSVTAFTTLLFSLATGILIPLYIWYRKKYPDNEDCENISLL